MARCGSSRQAQRIGDHALTANGSGRAGGLPPRHLSTRIWPGPSNKRNAAGDGLSAWRASRKAKPRHWPVSAATCKRRSARSSALVGQPSTAPQAAEVAVGGGQRAHQRLRLASERRTLAGNAFKQAPTLQLQLT